MEDSFFNKRFIIIIISLIWGFGIALLFRKICKNDECVVIKVPPQFIQSGSIIKDKNNHCYKLHTYYSECEY